MSVGTEKFRDRQRCTEIRKDGTPCTAFAVRDGLCVGHLPESKEARRKGGLSSSKQARLAKLVPARLQPIFHLLEKAMTEVHDGKLDPKQAQAMASLAGAMVRVLTAGEMETRLRDVEGALKKGVSQQ